MLRQNVYGMKNVSCYNYAVFPRGRRSQLFFSRYPGDGEAGLAEVSARTFTEIHREQLFEVRVRHPRSLPRCDILKIDVEGSEYEILANMNLTGVSIIVLEFQFAEIRDAIKRLLAADFILEEESNYPWEDILTDGKYRRDLAGDYYGLLKFANRRVNKLVKFGVTS
jgi:FkbM family methyltransferase